MLRDEAIARARSAVGKGVKYLLGAGGMNPKTPLPCDQSGRCDCTGFVAWVFGYSRHQPEHAALKKYNGGWLSTDGIVFDSTVRTGLWDALEGPDGAASTLSILSKSKGVLSIFPDALEGPDGAASTLSILSKSKGVLSIFPGLGGCCVVYPAGAGFKVGHAGILTRAGTVVHCAAHNRPDAIQETSVALFLKSPLTRIVSFYGLED